MAMPQRDETIEEIKRLDALLEYAVMHGDEAEAARLRAELAKLVEKVWRVGSYTKKFPAGMTNEECSKGSGA